MPSPFPGMNPYLERAAGWNDFHNRFIAAAAEFLTPALRPRYFAKIEEYVYIHETPNWDRGAFGRPDLSVRPIGESIRSASSGVALAVAPAKVVPPVVVDFERLPFLEIRDAKGRDVVTVLELLSPSNKESGADREQYLERQARLLKTQTHLIEIDLLRGGPRMPWGNMPECVYYAVVCRAADRTRGDFWPVGLRDRLPSVPIPLREGEAEPLLDLQAILDRIYDAAGYEMYIYDEEPEPRLAPADAAWAKNIMSKATV